MIIKVGLKYKADVQFSRIAIWFLCNGFSTIMGNLIAYRLAICLNDY